MIENNTLSIGGNTIFVYLGKGLNALGKKIVEIGDKMIVNNKTKYVTNPSATLVSPFILVINFTVDVSEKYQIVLQGDYKQNYIESKDSVESKINLTEDELFMIINQNRSLWFKKY